MFRVKASTNLASPFLKLKGYRKQSLCFQRQIMYWKRLSSIRMLSTICLSPCIDNQLNIQKRYFASSHDKYKKIEFFFLYFLINSVKPKKEKKVQQKNVIQLKEFSVALVGRTNVGKSTLLSRVTNADPKIANYHFTTLNPHLGVVDLDGSKGFVIADIPGLIDGASEGVGLGHDFLRHIERTKATIHVVDASGSEGRDPVADIYAINKELRAYNEDLANRPMVIAANKCDLIYPDGSPDYIDPIEKIKNEFEPKGIKVFKISALTGEGIKELLYYMSNLLKTLSSEPIVFEQEYVVSRDNGANEPFSVDYDEKEDEYVIEGPRIERMLGYTNLESEKGFVFFQNFMKENGILEMLEDLGIKDGDTVRIYGHSFEYYK